MRWVSFRGKVLIPLLAIGLPVCVAFLVMELVLRLLGTTSPVIHSDMFTWVTDDPLLPYQLRAGYAGVFGGGAVTVGADGNRVVPIPPGLELNIPSREFVLLGDSIVFGHSLDDKDTIAANLQRAIVPRRQLRVTMIAAPGYTSWNEFAAFSRYPRLANVHSLLLVYVSNDVTTNNDWFRFGETGGRIEYMQKDLLHKLTHFLNDNSRIYYLASDAIKKWLFIIRSAKGNGQNTGPVVVSEEGLAYSMEEGLAYSMEAIKKLQDLCRVKGINFIVGIYRDGTVYEQPDWVVQYEHVLSSRLSAIGVDHFVFKRATDELTSTQFAVSWNDNTHASAIASKIMAEEIVAELEKRGY
jgi:hypothetical protein